MNNPVPAFDGTYCDECGNEIDEGELVYFHDGEKHCDRCADRRDIVCSCGKYKNPNFNNCYRCSKRS